MSKKKLPDSKKDFIRAEIQELRSMADSMNKTYASLSKKDDGWFRDVIGTFTMAVRQASREIDKAIGRRTA